MIKNISVKDSVGFKEIKATLLFESTYKGESFYVLMGGGEVFALKKDEKFGFINVTLPNKEAYDELIKPIDDDFKNGLRLNDKIISLDTIPSVIWIEIPFEQLHGMKSLKYENNINKRKIPDVQYFYCIFSFLDQGCPELKQAFVPVGTVVNEFGNNEVIYENRIDLLMPYLEEIKNVSNNTFFNVAITVKDGKLRKCDKFFSYLNFLEEDDEQRFFISFSPIFNDSMRSEIEKSSTIKVVGNFNKETLTQKDYKQIFSDALSEKYVVVANDTVFRVDSSEFSKYRK